MNNDNTVKIGVALKWRNTFDTTKRYYQENVVTACGCVFRCKVLQAQGKSPIRFTDEQGHIVFTNTDIWDVLVDMAYYYNYTVDTRKLTKEMLDYAAKLDAAFQKQQKEIKALQDDNANQWKHVNDIETHNAEQQREINSIHDTISCFSEGIWIDTLLWSNVTIWDNNKYAITDNLQNQINELTETHHQDIKDLTEKHNSEISSLTTHIITQEKIQDGINTYLQNQVYDLNNGLSCFGSGVWENDLHWSQEALWDNNKYAITDALSEELELLRSDHNQDVKNINAHLLDTDKELSKAVLQNASEHRLVNDHLVKHDEEIEALQTLIKEHDQQILDLVETLTCYSYGQWDDGLKWGNHALWENSNLMCDTFDDLYQKIADHQKAIENLNAEIRKVKADAEATFNTINSTFEDFRKEHETFRKEHQEFAKEHNKFTERLDGHDTELAEHQHGLDSLLYRISILTNGVWDNSLLWNNDSDWNNTNLNGACHCPEDTEERLDNLRDKTDTLSRAILSNSQEIKDIKDTAVVEHRSVAYQFRAIAREQKAQDENIAKIGEHFSCYADGIWGDLFIWDNDLKWANQSGVVDEALEDLRSDVRNINQNIEDANEDIMTNLSLIRANHQLIESNIEAIQENREVIVKNQKNHEDNVKALRNEALTEHRQVAYQLRAIGREQTAQNEEIAKLGEHFNCFADGVWCNLFLWENDRLWANESGVIIRALEDIHEELDAHWETLDIINEEKDEHFSCFHDDVWCNTSVWRNDHLWPLDIAELATQLQKHDKEISALQTSTEDARVQLSNEIAILSQNLSVVNGKAETNATLLQKNQEQINANSENIDKAIRNIQNLNSEVEQQSKEFRNDLITEHRQVAYQLRAIGREQNAQNNEIAKIGEHFGCFVDGQWGNLFLWHNDHLWHNETGVIKEAISDIHLELDEIQENLANTMEETSEHFNCFGEGYWCNASIWSDDCAWKNGTHELGELYSEHRADIKVLQTQITGIDKAVKDNKASITAREKAHTEDLRVLRQEINTRNNSVDNILQAVQTAQTAHQNTIDGHQEKLDELWDGKNCLNEGKWNNTFFWDETALWFNTTESLKEIEAEVVKQDDRISALENKFALFLQQYAAQQTIIEQQKEQLETLMDCFTLLNVGKWQNLLLWDNNSKWSNILITEAANTVGTGGASTVEVKSYNSTTATVTI